MASNHSPEGHRFTVCFRSQPVSLSMCGRRRTRSPYLAVPPVFKTGLVPLTHSPTIMFVYTNNFVGFCVFIRTLKRRAVALIHNRYRSRSLAGWPYPGRFTLHGEGGGTRTHSGTGFKPDAFTSFATPSFCTSFSLMFCICCSTGFTPASMIIIGRLISMSPTFRFSRTYITA